MSMTENVAAMRITNSLRAAEIAADKALLKQSQLLTEMISARLSQEDAGLTGQAEIMRLVKAQQSLISSTNDLARVHNGLLDVAAIRGFPKECYRPRGEMDDETAIAAA